MATTAKKKSAHPQTSGASRPKDPRNISVSRPMPAKIQKFTFSKYHRPVMGIDKKVSLELDTRFVTETQIDVYDVLQAFKVTCPARQHAIKKLLAAGERGAKETAQDLEEARQSVVRAQELHEDYQIFSAVI